MELAARTTGEFSWFITSDRPWGRVGPRGQLKQAGVAVQALLVAVLPKPRWSGAAHHLASLEHVLDQLELVRNKKNVMHFELLGVGASGLHEQVARADAKQPVAEQVAAPLGDDHTQGVVGHLAAADLLA